jgi:hypothetical protein
MKTMVATRPTNTSTHSHQAMGSMLRRSAEVLGAEADPLPVGVSLRIRSVEGGSRGWVAQARKPSLDAAWWRPHAPNA